MFSSSRPVFIYFIFVTVIYEIMVNMCKKTTSEIKNMSNPSIRIVRNTQRTQRGCCLRSAFDSRKPQNHWRLLPVLGKVIIEKLCLSLISSPSPRLRGVAIACFKYLFSDKVFWFLTMTFFSFFIFVRCWIRIQCLEISQKTLLLLMLLNMCSPVN